MLLTDILRKCKIEGVSGPANPEVRGLALDSRKVEAGFLFFAVSGTQTDGHEFIDKAIEKGAVAVVCQRLPKKLSEKITYVTVNDSAYCLGLSASAFYGNPSEQVKLCGVTGTNGKTTIATLLYRLFTEAGFVCGLLSTIENRIGNLIVPASHTTPDPIALNALLAEMVAQGCSYAFMEVSSHAADQQRIAGLLFSGAIFTNLTHDHLDYHKTFVAYRDAKKKFFDKLPAKAFALINDDDRNARFMLQNCKAIALTYGLESDVDYKGKVLENQFEGLVLQFNGHEIYTRLIGRFNASNLLAVFGAACQLGLSEQEALQGISLLQSAEGRFEFVRSANGIVGVVDYAHTPDALENVLLSIHEIRTGNEKLITVVGAGGDRDVTKRPEMARIAAEMSDRLILTSDNPRTEDPEKILKDMQVGVPPTAWNRTLTITDRKEAIRAAVAFATAGDIILVAGKGHEKYQEIKGIRYPFDDKNILFTLLQNA